MGMNLFSLNRALDSGALMFSEGKALAIQKEGKETYFSTRVQMGNCFLLGFKHQVNENHSLIVSKKGNECDEISQDVGSSFD
jgi:hypothetical protein